MHLITSLLLALSASHAVLTASTGPVRQRSQRSSIPAKTSTSLLNSRQSTCSCHQTAFSVGTCSRCTPSGSSCSCPDSQTKRNCNEELSRCGTMALNGAACGSLFCSAETSGGFGGGYGDTYTGTSDFCPTGYKPCEVNNDFCIDENKVCCGGDESGVDTCSAGSVCGAPLAGGGVRCDKPEGNGGEDGGVAAASEGGKDEDGDSDDDSDEDDATSGSVNQGTSGGSTSTPKSSAAGSMRAAGRFGVLAAVVGGYCLM